MPLLSILFPARERYLVWGPVVVDDLKIFIKPPGLLEGLLDTGSAMSCIGGE